MNGPLKLGFMIAIFGSVLLLAAIGLTGFEKTNPQITEVLRAVVLVLLLFVLAIAMGIHIARNDIEIRPNTKIHYPTADEIPRR